MNENLAVRSLSEVGEILGIERKAVWHIERQAFKKLRKYFEERDREIEAELQAIDNESR